MAFAEMIDAKAVAVLRPFVDTVDLHGKNGIPITAFIGNSTTNDTQDDLCLVVGQQLGTMDEVLDLDILFGVIQSWLCGYGRSR